MEESLESHLVEEYLHNLSEEWLITREVWGVSKISGERKRIDAVIKSKTYSHMVFGVEFKRLDLGSFGNFVRWFKQALIYTQCEWQGKHTKQKLYILIAPVPNYCGDEYNEALLRIVGEFGIGDISKEYYAFEQKYVYKIRHKETTIWSSINGYNQSTIKTDFSKYLIL
jgi:hypothetical protein